MNIKIVQGAVSDGSASKPRYRTAKVDGRALKVRVIDADSPSFGADLAAAFSENVRRVRRENRKVQAAE